MIQDSNIGGFREGGERTGMDKKDTLYMHKLDIKDTSLNLKKIYKAGKDKYKQA